MRACARACVCAYVCVCVCARVCVLESERERERERDRERERERDSWDLFYGCILKIFHLFLTAFIRDHCRQRRQLFISMFRLSFLFVT